MLTTAEIEALVDCIADALGPERILLFGSYAKGAATIRSDLDLIAIKETPLPKERRADGLGPILSGSLVPIDVHVYTPEEIAEYRREPLSFVSSAFQSGRIVFEA